MRSHARGGTKLSCEVHPGDASRCRQVGKGQRLVDPVLNERLNALQSPSGEGAHSCRRRSLPAGRAWK